MNYNFYFELLEKVLEKFPSDYKENYYENKKGVVIETKKYIKSIYGENIIYYTKKMIQLVFMMIVDF